jgi:hypothetical protein
VWGKVEKMSWKEKEGGAMVGEETERKEGGKEEERNE